MKGKYGGGGGGGGKLKLGHCRVVRCCALAVLISEPRIIDRLHAVSNETTLSLNVRMKQPETTHNLLLINQMLKKKDKKKKKTFHIFYDMIMNRVIQSLPI